MRQSFFLIFVIYGVLFLIWDSMGKSGTIVDIGNFFVKTILTMSIFLWLKINNIHFVFMLINSVTCKDHFIVSKKIRDGKLGQIQWKFLHTMSYNVCSKIAVLMNNYWSISLMKITNTIYNFWSNSVSCSTYRHEIQ